MATISFPAAPSGAPRRRRGRWARGGIAALAIGLAVLACGWFAVHRVAWLGPWLADAGRTVLGDRAVAKLEDWSYAVDDAFNRVWRAGERPLARWQAPAAPVPATDAGWPSVEREPAHEHRPADVGPVHPRFAAAGDGVWIAVPDERHPELAPILYKTLLHPDEHRAWAELFVVAIDRAHVRLRLAAGTVDPEATTPEGKAYHRAGIIPREEEGALVAAFNGGFKTEHGHFGMRVDGVTIVAPRQDVCTVAALDDESIRIAPWTELLADEPRALWWRQTPVCMVHHGVLDAGLAQDASTRWGASVSGETVIRRSAIGLSEDGSLVYVGVSESTTAGALAQGMRHAGASDVAQLDVNWSYPKFLVFREGASGATEAAGLLPGFVFEPGEYLRHPAPKDFFYVLRR